MSFGGFDLKGARSIRVIATTLGGPGRIEVEECVLEVEYEDATREHKVVLKPNTMNYESFLSFIAELNSHL